MNAQFLEIVKGWSPLRTGFAVLPLAVGMMLASPLGVSAARRFGPRRVVAVGMFTIAAGLLLLSTTTRGTAYGWYTIDLLIVSGGLGLSAPALTTAVLSGLPPHQAGLGSGLNSASREVGAALGVAIIGTVLNSHAAWRSPAAFTVGTHWGYRALSVILIAATLAVIARWRTTTAVEHSEELHRVRA